jgi:GTP-binding protein
MRFVDEALITVRSGKGGNGCVSFRREKFVPKGGPDGGDGGKGGDVYLRASERAQTLYDFRLKRFYAAQNGAPGMGRDKHGQAGDDLVLEVPVGTIITQVKGSKQEELIGDLVEPGQLILVAQGGRGGKGNTHFKSSTRQTPRFAQSGEEGEEKKIRLELKVLADVGLIGLPNAGKSTLISALSAAKPKVAAYPFTTLIPQLGVVKSETGESLVLADIPGLIEGAHEGQGLGDTFLKHVERTKFLVHLLSFEDISLDDPWAGFDLIDQELARYDKQLLAKKQIRVVNKIDLCSSQELELLKEKTSSLDEKIYFISADYGQGLDRLVQEIWRYFHFLGQGESKRHDA